MQAAIWTCCLLGLLAFINVDGSAIRDPQCESNKYPPGLEAQVDTFVINLDLPPEQRWLELVAAKKGDVLKLRDALVDLLSGFENGLIIKAIDFVMPALMQTFPSPYKEEMQSLADASGMPLGEVVLYNLFYEFFTVCTSIVAQDGQGEVYHARNLDFGLFLGWDFENNTWSMTEVLRPTVVQLDWQRGGKTVFQSVNFAGYIGAITAMKPNGFTLTIDDRFKLNGGFIGIYEWIMGDRSQVWVGFLTRQLFENTETFEEAHQLLLSSKTLAPLYFILGGVNKGEGLVITKDRDSDTGDEYWIADTTTEWYVLQTNYDHWENPPFYDDRRTPGIKCMNQMTQQNGAAFNGLYDVLSTQPMLNKLTTYTVLMHAASGKMETYLQYCEADDCAPW